MLGFRNPNVGAQITISGERDWVKQEKEMKKRYLKVFSIHFIVILSITILKEKFIGITYKFNLNPVEPLTWSEISENLVSHILFSFILSLIMSYFLIYAVDEYKKQQIIDLEAARKRIEEKKKKDQDEIEKLNKDSGN